MNVLIVLGGAAVLAIVPLHARWTDMLHPLRTVQEAREIALSKGFYCISDEPNGISCRILIVSETPLTWHDAASLRMNAPAHPSWQGAAKIQSSRGIAAECYDPTCSVVWGGLFVYGDPEVIRKLTGMLPH
jgi:hypothetical protein